MEPSLENRLKYQTIPEIHAAVNAVKDMAEKFEDEVNPDLDTYGDYQTARYELLCNLIEFFGNYDQFRTQQIETLKAQLIDALQWSVKPMQSGPITKESPGS